MPYNGSGVDTTTPEPFFVSQARTGQPRFWKGHLVSTRTLTLTDGRRVKYGLKRRSRDPFYLVTFRDPAGRSREKSTAAMTLATAIPAAESIVLRAYGDAAAAVEPYSWADAEADAERRGQARRIRRSSWLQYRGVIRRLIEITGTSGPHEVDEAAAQRFLDERSRTVAASTVANQAQLCYTLWSFYWAASLGDRNPWRNVVTPHVERRGPLAAGEWADRFVAWLQPGPVVAAFLDVLRWTGARRQEIAALRREDLQDGRLVIVAERAKTRRERRVKLPADLSARVESLAGPEWVWSGSIAERQRATLRRLSTMYSPGWFGEWLQCRLKRFRELHPDCPYWTLHTLRGEAISDARQLGANVDAASRFFGVSPRVMLSHYERLDEQRLADDVADLREKAGRRDG